MPATTLLTEPELAAALHNLPAWSLRQGALAREWTFPGFAQAMLFVNRVATVAEHAQHHPDIDIRYNKVLLSLVSHDAGGITARDAAMARELNDMVS